LLACSSFFSLLLLPPRSTLFPYTTLFRSADGCASRFSPCRRGCASFSGDLPWHRLREYRMAYPLLLECPVDSRWSLHPFAHPGDSLFQADKTGGKGLPHSSV